MHLPSNAIKQIGKIIEQRENNTGPCLFGGLSTPAVKAIQNHGQKPSIAGTKFEEQLSQKFGTAVKADNINAKPSLYADNTNSEPRALKAKANKLG